MGRICSKDIRQENCGLKWWIKKGGAKKTSIIVQIFIAHVQCHNKSSKG